MFTGYNEEHGIPSTHQPCDWVLLHWTFSPGQAFSRGVQMRGSKVHCLPCSNSSKYLLPCSVNAHIIFTATSHYQWVHSYRYSARSSIQIYNILKSFHASNKYANENWHQSQACHCWSNTLLYIVELLLQLTCWEECTEEMIAIAG